MSKLKNKCEQSIEKNIYKYKCTFSICFSKTTEQFQNFRKILKITYKVVQHLLKYSFKKHTSPTIILTISLFITQSDFYQKRLRNSIPMITM